MTSESAPVLSTPAEHIFENPKPATLPSTQTTLDDEQLYVQYEIQRTVREIRAGRWNRIALQFPDEMLVDAPRVFEDLRADLRRRRLDLRRQQLPAQEADVDDLTAKVASVNLDGKKRVEGTEAGEEKLTILADTSYGACCVDEVAAEHVNADVIVHYGRSCLSPTQRLPVIYVFTTKFLDIDAAVASFKQTYQNTDEKICLMADIPYNHHLPALYDKLKSEGFAHLYLTEILYDPSSPLPNRTIPDDVKEEPNKLKQYSVFHISSPPTSLLLNLSSRVKSVHILPTDTPSRQAPEASTAQILRRRYGLVTRLATVPIFGILINTLSVKNYMSALKHCQDLIRKAGKKSYTFVVGKVNAAKVANFSEIGGWVVIGCWESSLIESQDFYRPIITPFELELALTDDKERVWGGEWVSDFSTLLSRPVKDVKTNGESQSNAARLEEVAVDGDWADQPSDDEPPEFDLRTGKYVSHSRPMGRAKPNVHNTGVSGASGEVHGKAAPSSSALVQRVKGDLATVNGAVSPAAEFLRSKRTWQGLGSDYEIAYERDAEGKIRGAAMEEGRTGVAKGYTTGQAEVAS